MQKVIFFIITFHISNFICTFAAVLRTESCSKKLSHGVMVAHQILVLLAQVRILVGQRRASDLGCSFSFWHTDSTENTEMFFYTDSSEKVS